MTMHISLWYSAGRRMLPVDVVKLKLLLRFWFRVMSNEAVVEVAFTISSSFWARRVTLAVV